MWGEGRDVGGGGGGVSDNLRLLAGFSLGCEAFVFLTDMERCVCNVQPVPVW